MHEDAFAVLGMAVAAYDVPFHDIQKQYRAVMSVWHPDRFAHSVEKAAAAQKSQRVNAAYRRLQNPIHRAEEVMYAHGWSVQSVPESSFFHWLLEQDACMLADVWKELEQSFVRFVQGEYAQEAADTLAKMRYVYPRITHKPA